MSDSCSNLTENCLALDAAAVVVAVAAAVVAAAAGEDFAVEAGDEIFAALPFGARDSGN